MSDLRSKLIRLAHTNPDLRSHLLPLLQKPKTAAVLRGARSLFQMVSRFASAIEHEGQVVSVVDFMRKELLDSMYTPAILADKPLIQSLVKLDQALLNLKDRYDYNERPNKNWDEVNSTLFKLSNQILKGVGKRVEHFNAAGRYVKQTSQAYGENISALIRIKKYLADTCKEYVNSPEVNLISQLDDVMNHLQSVYEDRDDLYIKPAEIIRRKWDEVIVLYKKLIAYK